MLTLNESRFVWREEDIPEWSYGVDIIPIEVENYDPNQPRDEYGRWTDTGAGTRTGAGTVGGGTDRISTPPIRADGRIELTHWSNAKRIGELDPSRHGTGYSGAERRRKEQDLDNWVDRTYYGVGVGQPGGYSREPLLGRERYTTSVRPNDLYDIGRDPAGLKPQDVPAGVNSVSAYEKAIHTAGYKGYWINHPSLGLVAAVFDKLPVESEVTENYDPSQSRWPKGHPLGGQWKGEGSDWFGRSKVVDASGAPLVVYHGTPATFDKFSTGSKIWFTTDPEYASKYGTVVRQLFVKAENPIVFEKTKEGMSAWARTTDSQLRRQGYDGVLFIVPPSGNFIGKEQSNKQYKPGDIVHGHVFSPGQVRFAEDFTGNYSPTQPRWPKGHPLGGQWRGGSATASVPSTGSSLLDTIRDKGGFTYQPLTRTSPKSGYAVATFRNAERVFDLDKITVEDIYDYITEHADKFEDPRVHLGAWVDDGKVYLDLSSVVSSRSEALRLGVEHDQLAVFDLGNMQTVTVPSERTLREKVSVNRFNAAVFVHEPPGGYTREPPGVGSEYLQGGYRPRTRPDGGRAVEAENFTANTRWRFLTNPQKLDAFRVWIAQRVARDLLGDEQRTDDDWWNKYVEEGYRRGVGRAYDDVRKPGLASTDAGRVFQQGSKQEFLRSAFQQRESVDKVKLLASRTYTDLKGVTEQMAQRLTIDLADGFVQGLTPEQIAHNIVQHVDGIGLNRARTIARTEIVRAHGEGQLDAIERMGLDEVGVAVEWDTADDGRVCPLCAPLQGIVLSIKEARGMLPRHPNCRCSYLPAAGSWPGRKLGKSSITEAIEESLEAEIPKQSKRSIAQQKRRSLWAGAGKRIAKRRPTANYDPSQPRDRYGRWTRTGSPGIPPEVKEGLEFAEWKEFKQLTKDRGEMAKLAKKTGDEYFKGRVQEIKTRLAELRKVARERTKGQVFEKKVKAKRVKTDITPLSKHTIPHLNAEDVLAFSTITKQSRLPTRTLHSKEAIDEVQGKLNKIAIPVGEQQIQGMPRPEKMVGVVMDGVRFQWNPNSGNASGAAAMTLYELAYSRERIPHKLWNSNTTVTFTRFRNTSDAHFARQFGLKEFKAAATAGSGDNSIVFYNGSSGDVGIFVHESAHNLAYKLWGTIRPPAGTMFWKANLKEGAVTAYGKHNIGEDFAESCRLRVTEPVKFSANYPVHSAALDELIRR